MQCELCNKYRVIYFNFHIEIHVLRTTVPTNNLPFTRTGDCIDWKQLINVAWPLSQCT